MTRRNSLPPNCDCCYKQSWKLWAAANWSSNCQNKNAVLWMRTQRRWMLCTLCVQYVIRKYNFVWLRNIIYSMTSQIDSVSKHIMLKCEYKLEINQLNQFLYFCWAVPQWTKLVNYFRLPVQSEPAGFLNKTYN